MPPEHAELVGKSFKLGLLTHDIVFLEDHPSVGLLGDTRAKKSELIDRFETLYLEIDPNGEATTEIRQQTEFTVDTMLAWRKQVQPLTQQLASLFPRERAWSVGTDAPSSGIRVCASTLECVKLVRIDRANPPTMRIPRFYNREDETRYRREEKRSHRRWMDLRTSDALGADLTAPRALWHTGGAPAPDGFLLTELTAERVLQIKVPDLSSLGLEEVLRLREDDAWQGFREVISRISAAIRKRDPSELSEMEIRELVQDELISELFDQGSGRLRTGPDVAIDILIGAAFGAAGPVGAAAGVVKSLGEYRADRLSWLAFLNRL